MAEMYAGAGLDEYGGGQISYDVLLLSFIILN
jgi:hypothetical protein